jgi:SAM-dependent methyltransferase
MITNQWLEICVRFMIRASLLLILLAASSQAAIIQQGSVPEQLVCSEGWKVDAGVKSIAIGATGLCSFSNFKWDGILSFRGSLKAHSEKNSAEIRIIVGAGQVEIARFAMASGQGSVRKFFIPSSALGDEKSVELRVVSTSQDESHGSDSDLLRIEVLEVEPSHDLESFKLARTNPIRLLSPEKPYKNQYVFSDKWDWFTRNIPAWERFLEPYCAKPGLNYLEVGVFEGRSLIWMLENILTNPSARATAIDLFGDFADLPADSIKTHFLENVRRAGAEQKVRIVSGYSQIELRRLPLASYDIIYIDGSHNGDDVLEDTLLAWRLLKEGGTLIFDDYAYPGVEFPVNAFLQLFGHHFEIIHRGYQLFLRKRPEP